MKCDDIYEVKKYLNRFDEILCQMKDKMLSTYITNNITINFIETMIPHHQAAIYMCENLLKYTEYDPLINIARNIIVTQTKGIEQMKEISMSTYGYLNSKCDVKHYEKSYFCITKNMICKMKESLRSNNINLNFVSEMIPHHEGAILMCENLLKYCIDPRLKIVAENIIEEQTNGVKDLKQIRKDLQTIC